MEKQLFCSYCGNDEIEVLAWVSPKTNKISGCIESLNNYYPEKSDTNVNIRCWCHNCQEINRTIENPNYYELNKR